MAIDKMVDSAKLDREMLATAIAIREKGKTEAAIPWEDEIGFEQAVLAINGGDAELNFEVVGGKTEPTNPKENTIWVDTDQEITGWSFSAEEPTDPTDGMVWIYTSTTSSLEFNALKKDGVMVYPLFAKQHRDGAWERIPAKIYQNGKWADWLRNLFPDGEMGNAESWAVGYKALSTGSISKNSGGLVLSSISTGSGELRTIFYAKEKIDVTNVHSLKIKLTISASSGAWRAGLISNVDIDPQGNMLCELGKQGTGEVDSNLDVSSFSGKYYFVVYYTSWSNASNQTHTVNVQSISALY